MVKFGLLTNPTINILKEIKTIRHLGADYVEIGLEWPEGAPQILFAKRKQIISLTKKFKEKPIGHSAWWIGFSTSYDGVRKVWIEIAKQNIDVAKSLGIKLLNFHANSRQFSDFYKSYKKETLENFVEAFHEVVKYAKMKKIHIMLENTPGKGEINDFESFKYIVDKTHGLKVHLDVAHAFINGGESEIKKFIFTFKNKIVHVHVSDNHGKFDEHLPLGKGKINFVQVVKLLKKINYNKTITFEVFTSKTDAKKSMLYFKKLWNKY